VDGQSDIYSLGVVLFEMLTGDVPFHGENQISVAMKHVREDLPDIQRIRPEVSATTAAVLDRMTEKDLAHRYADIPMLVADLEEALAIEAARSGTSTGEATAVIRTLPARARRRLPFRMRHPLSLLAVVALVGVAVAVVALIIAQPDVPGVQVQRGTGAGKVSETPEGTRVVSVQARSAHDYDPLGDDEEHREQTSRTVDRDEGTAWTTEQYPAGLEGAGKAGVGVYIDAKPRVEAVEMQIVTPEPGWRATIYAAPPGDVPKSIENGWKKVGGGTVSNDEKRFKLDTGGEQFRYYLVWITKLGPDAERAEISEIRLLQEVAA
jgi:serine/threonine-protein kinase